MTEGLDGGYVRSRDAPNRNEGWFEVIAGKSTVQPGESRCFAFVHRFDRHARARIGAVLKSQGVIYHQSVTFVTDGGDTVRSWPKRLHPRAEHVIDWFHIAMRFTVLKQMAKSLAIPDPNSDGPDDHSGPASVLSIDRRPLAQSARQGFDSADIHVASEWSLVIAPATFAVFVPRSFSDTPPSCVTTKVITPEERYMTG
jgi:hypothetical protein